MDIAWNAGINVKTIANKRRTATREVVIEESMAHYERLKQLIDSLADDALDLELTLTLRDVSVRLNLNETVVVINALAVRRAGLRGGAWSSIGKNAEGPLMETICRAFRVPEECFTRSVESDKSLREVDFNLFTPDDERVKCEVKLMGQGNPESADAVVARGSQVFVASSLSDLNKRQLDQLGVHWTELQREHGFLRFAQTLRAFDHRGAMNIIPVQNVPNQTFVVRLGRQSTRFHIWRQSRDGGWYASIESPIGAQLVSGRRISIGQELGPLAGFRGSIVCAVPPGVVADGSEPGANPWGVTHVLVYNEG